MSVKLTLLPSGEAMQVPLGTLLKDALPQGSVELICSGLGTCGKCRVQIISGLVPPTAHEQALLSGQQLRMGIRLACSYQLWQDTEVLLPPRETTASAQWLDCLPEQTSPDLLLAVDLGSTNLKLALLSQGEWEIVAQAQVSNRQKMFGADVLSRQHFANEHPQGRRLMQLLVVESLNHGLRLLRQEAPTPFSITRVAIAGNSVMLALLLGLQFTAGVDVAKLVREYPLAQAPATDLGLDVDESAQLCLLPPLANYVGSDMLACILTSDFGSGTEPALIVDIGTNVELALGTQEGIFVCSTAAGPAFEGGEISCGMSATLGAVHTVTWAAEHYQVQTIDNAPAIGVCGSGLFSAIAAARDNNQLAANGRLASTELRLTAHVALTQHDIRQFQLAKAAVRTGIDILLAQAEISVDAITAVYLAGDFGKHVAVPDLVACGLLPEELVGSVAKIERGCIEGIIRYCRQDTEAVAALLARIEHVELAAQLAFQERFVANMLIGPAVPYREVE